MADYKIGDRVVPRDCIDITYTALTAGNKYRVLGVYPRADLDGFLLLENDKGRRVTYYASWFTKD